jgi:hypothetical protein
MAVSNYEFQGAFSTFAFQYFIIRTNPFHSPL